MYKPVRIVAFLLVILGLVLAPVWLNQGRVAAVPAPSLDTQAINALEERQCVESTAYMRAEHMLLLDSWRTAVVRDGATTYTNSAGRVYAMSLEDSCLGCHDNRAEFCDACHAYVAAEPNCWSCHNGEEGVTGR